MLINPTYNLYSFNRTEYCPLLHIPVLTMCVPVYTLWALHFAQHASSWGNFCRFLLKGRLWATLLLDCTLKILSLHVLQHYSRRSMHEGFFTAKWSCIHHKSAPLDSLQCFAHYICDHLNTMAVSQSCNVLGRRLRWKAQPYIDQFHF